MDMLIGRLILWRTLLWKIFLQNDSHWYDSRMNFVTGNGSFWLTEAVSNLSSLPGRLQRGLSVETGQRQRSVPQPEVHPVWTGRRVEVLQQTRREPWHLFPAVIIYYGKNNTFSCWFLHFLQAREPKAIMKISSLNATFQPSKIGTPHGLQLTYLKDNSTRNIFVYHEDGKVKPSFPSSGGHKFSL